MSEQTYLSSVLDHFYTEGWIVDVLNADTAYTNTFSTNALRIVKSGKEATVYCCKANPSTGAEYLAVKIYRPRQDRSFKNDAVYQEGHMIRASRLLRAFENKSRKGREVQFTSWVEREFETLELLYNAGADIPRPIAHTSNAILMEYMGTYEQPAPILNNVALELDEAQAIFELLMQNVQLWLICNRVHADLSAFNILYWEGKVKVIDFPQAIDPRINPNAFTLLARDIDHVCRYLARYGVQAEPSRLAEEFWGRFIDNDW